MNHNPIRARNRPFWLLRYRWLLDELVHLTEMEIQYQAGEDMDLPADRLAEWSKEIKRQRAKIRQLATLMGKRLSVREPVL